MSGGEQQMLALARALMLAPRILLIDEPSVGLAPLLVSRTIDKIKELKEQYKLTVLMAEQNFIQAIRIADRGYVIVHGKIAFEGRSADELNNNELINRTTAGYHAPAFPLAGLACERRDASQACDLAAREAAEFGDICQEGAGKPIADTRERDQQVLLLTPNRRAAHHGVDIAVDDGQFVLESCNGARGFCARARRWRVSRAGVRRPASR